MISLTARVRPAHEASSYLIREVATRLREFDHVRCAPGQLLVSVPQLGSALVSETRSELLVNVVMPNEDAAARASAALVREVTTAVGSRVSARHLSITWTREQFVPALLR